MIIKCTELEDGRINLSFPYNPQLIDKIKALRYRKYDPDTKTWSILAESLDELKNSFPKGKFECNFDTENAGLVLDTYYDDEKESIRINTENLPFLHNKSYQRLTYVKNPSGIYRIKDILEENGYKVKDLNFGRDATVELQPNIQLYPYQEECVDFFIDRNYSGINALSMGLGKTFTSLMCFHKSDAKNLLIVAPAGLLQQWKNVLQESFNTKATIVNSKTKPEDRKRLLQTEPLVITSFDILWRVNANIEVDMLIVDEASKIKNWKTKRAQALHNVIAKYRIALSGTPIENRVIELFNIADNTVPAFYGSLKTFYKKYTGTKQGETVPLERLYEKNKELVFRRTKEEVANQLPEKVQMDRHAILSQKELDYADYLKSQEKENIGILAELKVHASNPAIYMDIEKSSKEKLLEELLVDDLEGRKVVVFTQYTSNIPRFKKIAQENNIKALYLSGENSKELETIRDKFVEEDYQVLFLTEVGEYGLDKLQVSDVLINFDLPYNPAKIDQRVGRIHRIGSNHDSILVINLISDNTIDEYLVKLLNNKTEVQGIALKGIKQYLIEMLELEDNDLKVG